MILRALLATTCVLAFPPLPIPDHGVGPGASGPCLLRQAQNQDDRLALHSQLQALWVEAAEAGQLMDVDWTSWNEAVVDLGKVPTVWWSTPGTSNWTTAPSVTGVGGPSRP